MSQLKTEVIGTKRERTLSIITEQPLIRAANPKKPHPGEPDIIKYFEDRGYVAIGPGGWFHPDGEIMVTDTKPDNFIQTKRGPVPIDLMAIRPEGELLELIREKVRQRE